MNEDIPPVSWLTIAAVILMAAAIPGGVILALYLDEGWPLIFTVIGLILGLAG